MDILLDTVASKSYMSIAFYMRHEHLHHFPNFNLLLGVCKLAMEP